MNSFSGHKSSLDEAVRYNIFFLHYSFITLSFFGYRRSILVEGIISEFQREDSHSHVFNDNDSEEGAKLLKILETAAEPEVIMAEMSPEQLTSFSTYQAKLEVIF